MSDPEFNDPIERIEAPSRDEFETRFLNRNTPVILTGVCNQWSAMTRWTPEYLREVAGDAVVTVHYDKDGNFHRWYLSPEVREERQMTLRELLDKLLADPPDERFYMTEHTLAQISERLVKEVDLDRYVDNPMPQLFLGRETRMPLHYHGVTEALLCQLRGSKKVTLYSPDQYAKLYPGRWYAHSPLFSRVDCRNPDYQAYPRFKDAVPLRFMLEPGEVLFIPVQWWHFTRVDGQELSLSITAVWRSKVSRYTFPSPGLQTIARDVLRFVRGGLRRVLPIPG